MTAHDRDRLVEMLQAGISYTEIAATLRCAKSTVCYHAGKIGLRKTLRKYDWQTVQAFHDAGNNYSRCRERFGFSKDAWDKAIQRGELTVRDWQIPLNDLLQDGRATGRRHLKARLRAAGLLEECCAECGLTEWRGKPLSFDLHHINGRSDDNRLENLVLLCPNCHSQTPNYCGRNIRKQASA